MANQVREWHGKTPWQELAEIADRVIRVKGFPHWKPSEEPKLIHAGTWDFASEFELYVKRIIAEAELRIIEGYGNFPGPAFGIDAIEKQKELNDLIVRIAKREYPKQ